MPCFPSLGDTGQLGIALFLGLPRVVDGPLPVQTSQDLFMCSTGVCKALPGKALPVGVPLMPAQRSGRPLRDLDLR